MQQTVAVKFKLLAPNRGKVRQMQAAGEAYRQACAWFAAAAERLQTSSRTILHRATYAQARELFDLNSATLQEAMLKALTARKSYLTKRQRDKKARPPQFNRPLPVSVRQDCYRVRQLPRGSWIVTFPVASGSSQIAVPLLVAPYHKTKLRELAGGTATGT